MFISINKALAASKARREEGEKGFTLIELLVVVLIIGILSAIAIPIFLNQQAAARDSAVQSDLTNLKVALVSALVSDPNAGLPPITDPDVLAEFTKGDDSNITLYGDESAFCIQGNSIINGTTTTYAASNNSGTVEGTCTTAGVLVATAP